MESKSNDLFHAAWDRTIDKSLEGYDENMNKGDENLDKHYQNCPGCLCDLRAENDQLKKTILSSSDLYEKLVTKQLQAERELADELAKSLRECMTWWDDEFYDSDTALKKYDERRAMDEEQ